MSVIHVGTETTLAAIPTASINNNDVAYIWLNGWSRKMVFDAVSTKAEDTTNHPYYLRPSDYSTGGVWVEEVGADQPQAWNGSQIRTGAVLSIDWDPGLSGMMLDLDNELIAIKDAVFGNAGIQIGWLGSKAKLSVKADADNFLQFDGSKLTWKAANTQLDASGNLIATSATLSGTITASAGTIGGFTLGATTLTATNLLLDAGNQRIKLGSGNDIITLDAADATYRLAIGHATYASAPFRVTKAGAVTATSGTVGGWTLSGTELSSTGIKLTPGASSQILLGSDVSSYANAAIGLKNDGSGKLASGNISWTAAGLLTQTVGTGGTITLDAGADIILTGADSDPGTIYFNGTSNGASIGLNATGGIFEITPSDDNTTYLNIGNIVSGIFGASQLLWSGIRLYGLSAAIYAYSSAETYNRIYLTTTSCNIRHMLSGANYNIGSFVDPSYKYFSPSPDNTFDLGQSSYTWKIGYFGTGIQMSDNAWIGLGSSAGRIVYTDAEEDYLSFSDCNVAIGLADPGAYKLNVTGDALITGALTVTGGITLNNIQIVDSGNSLTMAAGADFILQSDQDDESSAVFYIDWYATGSKTVDARWKIYSAWGGDGLIIDPDATGLNLYFGWENPYYWINAYAANSINFQSGADNYHAARIYVSGGNSDYVYTGFRAYFYEDPVVYQASVTCYAEDDAQYISMSFGEAATAVLVTFNESGVTVPDDYFVGLGSGKGLISFVDAGTDCINFTDCNVGVGLESPVAKVHIDQASTTAAIPVLILDQADVSEPFIKLIGAAAASNLTQSIVAEASVTSAARAGFIKVNVQDDGNRITDQDYFIPIYTLA